LAFLSSFNKQNHLGTKFKIAFDPLDGGKPFCVAELLYIWVDEKNESQSSNFTIFNLK